jgi:hypothetical protein
MLLPNELGLCQNQEAQAFSQQEAACHKMEVSMLNKVKL